jgi:hypothetical protein
MGGSDESGEIWKRVEANERLARSYLNEHEPHYAKHFDYPIADWNYRRQGVLLGKAAQSICGAHARLYTPGGPAPPEVHVVSCKRQPGHPGEHVAGCTKIRLLRWWKVLSWPSSDTPSADAH